MKYALASLFLWCAMTLAASAHEVRPAYLELRETAPEIYDVMWKVPARGENLRLALYVRLPADTRNVTEPHAQFTEAAYVERWRIQRPGGLAGQDVTIEGLAATKVDALNRVTDLEGATQTTRATPDLPTVTIAATASRWQVAGTYLVLGIEHILLGIDHLLFVLALVLLVKGWRKLVATVTAFTLAPADWSHRLPGTGSWPSQAPGPACSQPQPGCSRYQRQAPPSPVLPRVLPSCHRHSQGPEP